MSELRPGSQIIVTDVAFVAASEPEGRRGLRGWVTCVVNGALKLNSLTLRRTRGGRYTLGFPARRDGGGRQRFYFHPLDDHARRAIETQVFAQLGLQELPR